MMSIEMSSQKACNSISVLLLACTLLVKYYPIRPFVKPPIERPSPVATATTKPEVILKYSLAPIRKPAARAIATPLPYSISDLELVARIVIAESGHQSYDGQLAVAQTIYDRLHCATYNFGSTLKEVIFAPKQFAKPWKGDISIFPDAYRAAYDVFINGVRVFDEPVLWFFGPKTANPKAMSYLRTYNYLGTIGGHEFRGAEQTKEWKWN